MKADSKLQIHVSSDIEKGNLYFSIYSEDGTVLYEIEGDHLEEEKEIEITKGVWKYYFECCAKRGDVDEYAENGEYSIDVRFVE